MLRVFEAFSGYGSQRMALRNIAVEFESVGISEIESSALLSYAAIHSNFLTEKNNIIPENPEEMISFLEKINVPLDYKTFENKAKKLSATRLKEMYLANKLINNFGDIKKIDPECLPDFDLFTYSFPCQDISIAGFQHGLSINSGTRSSLLWECCKIIEAKKPKYLMMENVKNLVGNNHRDNFLKFLNYLEHIGYINSYAILNARNYGIPHQRERVFCISEFNGRCKFKFPDPVKLNSKLTDLLEKDVNKRFYLNDQLSNTDITPECSFCLDANYWKGASLNFYNKKHKRQLVTDRINAEGKFMPRRLTPRECWRLMGTSDLDFEKASKVVSNTSLYKLAGNSIVVPVLEAIFRKMFKS